MHAINKQNCMAPRRTVIIVCRSNFPIFIPKSNQIHHLQMVFHPHLHQPLQHNRIINLLQSDPIHRLLQRIKQIYQFLIINFQYRTCNTIFMRFSREDNLQSSRNQSITISFFQITKHCICLTWTCLPIGKYRWILTFKEAINMTMRNRAKNLFLSSIFPKDKIKAILIFSVINHILVISDLRGCLTRPKSAIHFNIPTFLSTSTFLITLILIWFT